MCTFDISDGDFSPTLLYFGKGEYRAPEQQHSHSNVEIVFIHTNKCNYRSGEQNYSLSPGDIIISNPGVLHGIIPIGDKPAFYLYIGFQDFHLKEMPCESLIFHNGDTVIHTTSEWHNQINILFEHMLLEKETTLPGKYFMLRSYLIQLLLLLIRVKQQEGYNTKKNRCDFLSYRKGHIVAQIMEFINKNYKDKLSLDQLSKNVYLSPVYICKVFKDETGESPISYLIRVRLEAACELLKGDRSMSIQEVAEAVGYDNVYHFSKQFKKLVGVSPTAFKSNS